jgi:uncharacterized protein
MVRITKEQKELIEKNIIAFATSDSGRNPNVIAVAFCKVYSPDKILITDNFMNKTRKNILNNSNISLAVWNQDMETGFQFKGKAQYLTEGKWKEIIDKDENNKGLAHKAAVLLTVREIWDLANPKLICKD